MRYASNIKVKYKEYKTETKYDMKYNIKYKTQNQDKTVLQYAPNIKVLSTPIPLAIVARHKDRRQR